MDKNIVKKMVCKAIDNIPKCAEIVDCYTEHSFLDNKAYIEISIKVEEETNDNIIEFNNIANKSFNSGMGFFGE